MRRKLKRKTDAGTTILHWTLVCALVLSTVTGLRIASAGQSAALTPSLEGWLPAHNVWFFHIMAGVTVMVVAVAYPTYLNQTGLARRVRIDWSRVRSLGGKGSARWGGLNVLIILALVPRADGVIDQRPVIAPRVWRLVSEFPTVY
jgi:hypothetical protein